MYVVAVQTMILWLFIYLFSIIFRLSLVWSIAKGNFPRTKARCTETY